MTKFFIICLSLFSLFSQDDVIACSEHARTATEVKLASNTSPKAVKNKEGSKPGTVNKTEEQRPKKETPNTKKDEVYDDEYVSPSANIKSKEEDEPIYEDEYVSLRGALEVKEKPISIKQLLKGFNLTNLNSNRFFGTSPKWEVTKMITQGR